MIHTDAISYTVTHHPHTHYATRDPACSFVIRSVIACFAEGLLGVYATANFAKVRPPILPCVLLID